MTPHAPDIFAGTAGLVMARDIALQVHDAPALKDGINRQTVLQKNLWSAEMPALLAGGHPESR
jgi:hypothetical protein